MMNLDGTGGFTQPDKPQSRVIIRGNSPQEVERKNLEYQQQEALRNKFFKTTDLLLCFHHCVSVLDNHYICTKS
jgi:hypothetical protein